MNNNNVNTNANVALRGGFGHATTLPYGRHKIRVTECDDGLHLRLRRKGRQDIRLGRIEPGNRSVGTDGVSLGEYPTPGDAAAMLLHDTLDSNAREINRQNAEGGTDD